MTLGHSIPISFVCTYIPTATAAPEFKAKCYAKLQTAQIAFRFTREGTSTQGCKSNKHIKNASAHTLSTRRTTP